MNSQTRLEREDVLIRRVMEEINGEEGLLPRDYVVSGSGAMVLHGIDRGKQIGDIDLFVTTEAWFSMHRNEEWGCYVPASVDGRRRHDPPFLYQLFRWDLEGKDTIEVNIFFDWRLRDHANIDVKELFNLSSTIAGVPAVDMGWLLGWKEAANRDKDQPDIPLIRQFLDLQERSSQ